MIQGNYPIQPMGYGYAPQPMYTPPNFVNLQPQQQRQGSSFGGGDVAQQAIKTAAKKTGILNKASFGANQLAAKTGIFASSPVGAVGPMQVPATPGIFGTTTTFTQALPAAAIGSLAGSYIADWTGGNATGGSIGGAIGGGAGSLAAGTALGTTLGMAGNFILPGIGMIAGGLLGSMIGGKPPANVSDFVLEFDDLYSDENYVQPQEYTDFGTMRDPFNEKITNWYDRDKGYRVGFGNKSIGQETGKQVSLDVIDFMTSLQAETGIKFNNPENDTPANLKAGYNDKYRDGFFIETSANRDLDNYGAPVQDDTYRVFKWEDGDDASKLNAMKGAAIEMLKHQGNLNDDTLAKVNAFASTYVPPQARAQEAQQQAMQFQMNVPTVAGRKAPVKRFEDFRNEYIKNRNKNKEGM